jgi:transcriptional regulator with XRE-family HTH domain
MPLRNNNVYKEYSNRGLKSPLGVAQYVAMAKQRHFLKAWRKYRGLTQEQFCERMGVTQGQVSKIEAGKKDVELSYLELAADVLRCEVVDLIIRDPASPEAIWSVWDHLAPPEQQQLVEIGKTFKKVG